MEKTSRAESEAYFALAARSARALGAWASPQSRPIAGREELERQGAPRLGERFAEGDVPLPGSGAATGVRPEAIEFWQGRPSRLHDRFATAAAADGGWRLERLAP